MPQDALIDLVFRFRRRLRRRTGELDVLLELGLVHSPEAAVTGRESGAQLWASASGDRPPGPARPATAVTPVGTPGVTSASWTPLTQVTGCPRNWVNSTSISRVLSRGPA
jgi:hypothetical protein